MEKRIQTFGRDKRRVTTLIWDVFDTFASPCRMLIEVFIRKDFGERYFRLSRAVSTCIIVALLPYMPGLIGLLILKVLASAMEHTGHAAFARNLLPDSIDWSVPFAYVGWYIYLLLFLIASFRHHKAMKRNPSVFDFTRYSRDSGRILDVFYTIKIGDRRTDRRMVECWLEPAPFFLGGLLLALIGQALGLLLMFCAVAYAVSYRRAYEEGDNFVLDQIDRVIINEELAKTFLGDDEDDKETSGYRFRGRTPSDPLKRKAVHGRIKDQEDVPLAE